MQRICRSSAGSRAPGYLTLADLEPGFEEAMEALRDVNLARVDVDDQGLGGSSFDPNL